VIEQQARPLRVLFITYAMYGAPWLGPAMIGVLKRCLRLIALLPAQTAEAHWIHSGAVPQSDPLVAQLTPSLHRHHLRCQQTLSRWSSPRNTKRGSIMAKLQDNHWLYSTCLTIAEQGVPLLFMTQELRRLYKKLKPDVLVLGECPLSGLLQKASLIAHEQGIPQVCIDDYLGPAQPDQYQRDAPWVDQWFLTGLPLETSWGRISDHVVVAPPLLPAAGAKEDNDNPVDVLILGYDPRIARLGLQVLARLPAGTTARLIHAGLPAEQQKKLQQLTRNHTVQWVSLPDEIRLRSLLRSARLVVCKSGFQQIVEALAVGTPVLACEARGAVPELFLADMLRPFVRYVPEQTDNWTDLLSNARRWLTQRPAMPWVKMFEAITDPTQYASTLFNAALTDCAGYNLQPRVQTL
jgi:hypothetical protein